MHRLADRVVKSTQVACLAIALSACRSDAPATPPRNESRAPAPAAPTVSQRQRIVVLGDSLTAGLGLDPAEAYPAQLQKKIDAEQLPYEISSAGVSGDTSAGGVSRLDWALGDNPRILIVALGGNDALRGLPIAELKRNLSTIVERAQARQISVILAGMEAPPNFGRDYIAAFHQVYPDLARQYRLPLVPFLLQDVAGIESLNQRDGIHPTAEGARIVANNVWAVLRPMLNPT